MTTPQYRFGPTRTPRPLKVLIFFTFLISLFTALFSALFQKHFGTSLEEILGLSSVGIQNHYFWQLITYFFIHPFTQGISFSFLLSLAFSLYLMWVIGASIMQSRGSFAFLCLYFISGIAVGLIVLGFEQLAGISLLFSGNTATLYTILIAWIMLYPDAQLLLLLALPLKAKWLVLSILLANLLIDFSTGQWLTSVAYLSGALFGYLYTLLLWKTKGPFIALHPFEEKIITFLGGKPEQRFQIDPRAKIYDFKTGKAILSDDEFLEAMLTKISLNGKGSLTWKERWRLRRIKNRRKK